MKKVIALIPCRGNSKGIKNKNLVNFFGKPLMYWTIKQLKDCKIIKEIYVSSDSKKILNYAEKLKVSIIKRPSNISNGNSQSEDAILHAIKKKKLNSDIIVFPQVTSPLRPKNVSFLPPILSPRDIISFMLRVNSAARALSPDPRPSEIPVAIA